MLQAGARRPLYPLSVQLVEAKQNRQKSQDSCRFFTACPGSAQSMHRNQ
jgi:hypothetical protein